MNFDLDRQHQEVRQAVRDFVEKEIVPVAYDLDEAGQFCYQIVRRFGELGLMALPFPKELGGGGADTLSYAIMLEELGRVYPAAAATIQANISLGGFPILMFGTEWQKEKYLIPLIQGKTLGAMGLTEPNGGSDAGNCATVAVLKDEEWVINGAKCFITNAGTDMTSHIVLAATTGQRPDGRRAVSAFVVPTGASGFTLSKPMKKLGLDTSDTRELYFEDCRLPKDHLLGEEGRGFKHLLQVLDDGRVEVAAIALGIAQGCLDLCIEHVKQNALAARPAGQADQFILADMATGVEHARLMTYKSAWLKDMGRRFGKEASMAKLYASELAQRSIDLGTQMIGEHALLREHPITRLFRDAKLFTIVEGTSEIQRMVIARHIGC